MRSILNNVGPVLQHSLNCLCSALLDRLEKMNMKCVYSKLKILGTLLCVFGALTMSLMHSASIIQDEKDNASIFVFDRDRVVGCIYLLGAVFVLSTNVVLQVSKPVLHNRVGLVSSVGLKLGYIYRLRRWLSFQHRFR